MKRGAPDHDKMHDLARALRIPLYAANGIMERLWHYTAKRYPQGDVGRASDDAIARACAWGSNPERLVKALLEVRWLDPVSEVPSAYPTGTQAVPSAYPPPTLPDPIRFAIHDWNEHMDEGTKKLLARKGLKPILSGQCPDSGGNCPDSVQTNPDCLSLSLSLSHSSDRHEPQAAPKRKRVAPVKADPERDSWFEEWYAFYPRHTKRDKALAAFRKHVTSRELCDRAIDAVKGGLGGVKNPDPQFIPYPATWLNDKPWEDEKPTAIHRDGPRLWTLEEMRNAGAI